MIRRRELLGLAALPLVLSPLAILGGCQRRQAVDFAIVGSGPAGLALADSLASAGRSVVVVEGGGRQPQPALQALHDVEPGQHGLPYTVGWATQRLLGGTTHLWESHSPRPWREELASKSLRDFGEDWPWSLEDLEPWLRQAENWLHVRPAHPESNPQAAINPYIAQSEALRATLSAAGYRHLEAAAYGMVEGHDRDALRLLADGVVDRIADRGTVTLLAETVVRRVRFDGRRATGIDCMRMDGQSLQIDAGAVVICGGGVQTARLLWNSAEGDWVPGNHSDWLGRGFMEHPGLQFYGRTREPLMPAGAAQVHLHVRDNLLEDAARGLGAGLLHVGLKRGRAGEEYYVAEMLYEQAMNPANRIYPGEGLDRLGDPLPKMDYQLSALDQRTIEWQRQWQQQVAQTLGTVDDASELRPGSHHLMGATRASSDRAGGVVNTSLQVWGVDNLYVGSSSVFPSGLSVPPTLVLVALCKRLAAHLLGAA